MKKIIFLILLTFLCFEVLAVDYIVDTTKSKVKWHLFIDPKTDVYGEIPISEGVIRKMGGGVTSGHLSFSLNKTKSYELEKGEKQLSAGRDRRIYSISGSKKKNPIFKFTSLIIKNKKAYVSGDLTLNEITKKIKLSGDYQESKGRIVFDGKYTMKWADYDIGNPVMWIVRAIKTASENISLEFHIIAHR